MLARVAARSRAIDSDRHARSLDAHKLQVRRPKPAAIQTIGPAASKPPTRELNRESDLRFSHLLTALQRQVKKLLDLALLNGRQ